MHGTQAPTRYAVRQVLDQEVQKLRTLRENAARLARFRAGNLAGQDEMPDEQEKWATKPKAIGLPIIPVKKDFFGRLVKTDKRPAGQSEGHSAEADKLRDAPLGKGEKKVWVTFHEGMNNAVRKPISLNELLRGL